MAVHILSAKMAYLGPLRFWAERGLVHCEDSRDNSYKTYAVRTILERVNGLNEMLGRSSRNDLFRYSDQVTELRNYIDDIVAICQQAREQGEPTDASARRDLARRRKKQVVVPNVVDMSYFGM